MADIEAFIAEFWKVYMQVCRSITVYEALIRQHSEAAQRRCPTGILGVSGVVQLLCIKVNFTMVKELEGLKVALWLELLLHVRQLLDQTCEGDSPLRHLLPALAHQIVHL